MSPTSAGAASPSLLVTLLRNLVRRRYDLVFALMAGLGLWALARHDALGRAFVARLGAVAAFQKANTLDLELHGTLALGILLLAPAILAATFIYILRARAWYRGQPRLSPANLCYAGLHLFILLTLVSFVLWLSHGLPWSERIKPLAGIVNPMERLENWRSGLGLPATTAISLAVLGSYFATQGRDLLKLILAFRRSRPHRWLADERKKANGSPGTSAFMLPSRARVLTTLLRTLETPPILGDPGHLLGLEGDWGSGKSTLLWNLRKALAQTAQNGAPTHALVWVDIWANERRRDLHAAIVETILDDPEILRRAHRAYPLSYFLCSGRLARAFFPNGAIFRMKGPRGEAEAAIAMDIPWQSTLRRVVERATQHAAPNLRGWRPWRRWKQWPLLSGEAEAPSPDGRAHFHIVVVLDELDRACPEAAQAAVVLARRALEEPGVTVLLPFVPDQIHHKVFNPLQTLLPDLGATIHAILESEYGDQVRQYPLPTVAPSPAKPGEQVPAPQPGEGLLAALREIWHRETPERKRQLQAEFSEKYLAESLSMPGLDPGDLETLLNSPPLDGLWKDLVDRIFPPGRSGAFDYDALARLTASLQQRAPRAKAVVPRTLIGRYLEVLKELEALADTPGKAPGNWAGQGPGGGPDGPSEPGALTPLQLATYFSLALRFCEAAVPQAPEPEHA